jgi:hypothetical protein
MHLLTPQGERSLEQLAPPDRLKVVRVLASPVRQEKCRKLARLGRYGLWHFNVTRSIRVTYRILDGSACVLHVGTHPEFDHFVDHYSGNVPNKLILIEESTVMKQLLPKGDTSSTKDVGPLLPAASAPAPLPSSDGNIRPDVPEVLRPLLLLFGAALAESCRQTVMPDIDSMCELVREELGGKIRSQADQLDRLTVSQDQLAQQLHLQETTLVETRDRLTEAVETVLQQTARFRGTLDSIRAQLDNRLGAAERAMDAQLAQVTAAATEGRAADRAEFSRELDAVAHDLAILRGDAGSSAGALAARIDQAAEQEQQLLAQIDALGRRQQAQIDEANARIDATVTVLKVAEVALAGAQEEFARLKAAPDQQSWKSRIAHCMAALRKACAYLVPRQWISTKR